MAENDTKLNRVLESLKQCTEYGKDNCQDFWFGRQDPVQVSAFIETHPLIAKWLEDNAPTDDAVVEVASELAITTPNMDLIKDDNRLEPELYYCFLSEIAEEASEDASLQQGTIREIFRYLQLPLVASLAAAPSTKQYLEQLEGEHGVRDAMNLLLVKAGLELIALRSYCLIFEEISREEGYSQRFSDSFRDEDLDSLYGFKRQK